MHSANTRPTVVCVIHKLAVNALLHGHRSTPTTCCGEIFKVQNVEMSHMTVTTPTWEAAGTKFKVFSFSRPRDISGGRKILKRVTSPWQRPFQGWSIIVAGTCYCQCQLWSLYLHPLQNMKGSAKCRKWGGLGRLGASHSRLSATSEHIFFYFLVFFCFYTFLVVGSVR